jgi:transcriptional regulator GlxA family with amidase domain
VDITALVFNGVIAQEVLAPVEAAASTAPVSVRYVSTRLGRCNGFDPFHVFTIDADLTDLRSTDLLIVPGGFGSTAMMGDSRMTTWIWATAHRSSFVMSVSTGSLLLAAAGLLEDAEASGHWLAHDVLASTGARPTTAAVSRSGSIITTSGAVAAAEVGRNLPERLMFGPAA